MQIERKKSSFDLTCSEIRFSRQMWMNFFYVKSKQRTAILQIHSPP